MGKINLSRMEPVDLREVWDSESGSFTPWLAEEQNLALLGEVIGLELELEQQEKGVGPFRADVLCKDTTTGEWVLIENQLERTDHTHLGQLLTYAAGLEAVTIVWIVERFTEEHRATLDWLNEITDEKFNFFGLEIELWRIGDSPVAPKFNMVCKPNDWVKSVSHAATGEITETKQMQLEFWIEFREFLLSKKGSIKPPKPMPQHWMNFAVGRSGFYLYAYVDTRKLLMGIGLAISPPDSKAHFHLLARDKDTIEKEIGEPLEWLELPNRKESRIALRNLSADPYARGKWRENQEWLFQKLEAFHKSFAPRVKELDASEYGPQGNS